MERSVDDQPAGSGRRRAPSAARLQFEAAMEVVRPIRPRVGPWNDEAARLEAIANAGRGTPEHLAAAEALLASIQKERTVLSEALSASTAIRPGNSYTHDLEQSLDRVEKRSANALALLARQLGQARARP